MSLRTITDITYALSILQDTSANTVLPNGLVQGHAYTVTGVKQVTGFF